ncbi:MAG TPA: hypothetical protein VGL94_12525, partial [Ktedonobacteraceae bacterium]
NVLQLDKPSIPLTSQEQIVADDLYKALATTLQARGSAIAQAVGTPLVGEWSSITGSQAAALANFPDWVLNPQNYIGEFVEYLASRRVRNAVKGKLKEQLRPLVGKGDAISIIAHSWGTVVAYESLIDLEAELPAFQLTDLFTLGSPLWMVQQLLDDRSGRKPRNTKTWINIHAQGDVIGSWLTPGFQVDKDFSVLDFDNSNDPHGSYFLPGNVAVQRDIVEVTIVGP